MLYIYVDQVTERLLYTLDFVFRDQDVLYHVTNDALYFENSDGAKLNYSDRQFDGVRQLKPSSLLFEDKVERHVISVDTFFGESCLMINQVMDPLASIFYILSMMEEYTSKDVRDHHNRFQAQSSILYKNGLLQTLVCDRLVRAVVNELFEKNLLANPYKISEVVLHPSFDIDHAYAYLQKDTFRAIGAKVVDFLKGNKSKSEERKRVLNGAQIDPYDTFEYIRKISERFPVHIFWLLGNYGQFDRNVHYANRAQRDLIARMAQNSTIGIHPSYLSNSKDGQLREEIGRLKGIVGAPITHSRQHFLNLQLPFTYQRLVKEGIRHDFTCGYAASEGFRVGTLRPFRWFDLSKNQISELVLHPFAYMDGTLNEYQKYSIDEAKNRIQMLYDETKQFGGEFSFLWHNETIGDHGIWKGWSEVLEYTLNLK